MPVSSKNPGRRFEYKSAYTIFGLPLVHVVIGRDPKTGRLGRARGIIAIGRLATGVVALGQIAIGVLSLGQLSLGLFFSLGQLSVAGWQSAGQLAAAPYLAVGQIAAGRYAVGQLVVGQYAICQEGLAAHKYSEKEKSRVALDAFQAEFPRLNRWVGRMIGADPAPAPNLPAELPPGKAVK